MSVDGGVVTSRLPASFVKAECLLSVRDVSLRYGSRLILRDVDADIYDIVRPGFEQGQVVCFLGPSGIGKTQLSRIIAGLQAPTTGQVLVAGRPVEKGVVGMVPQQYRLFEFATVAENLKIAASSKAGWRDRAQPYLQLFDLERYLDHYPKALSGGTRQRVAIVRQVLSSEHFIIMDEPFSGLDVRMKERAVGVIRTLSQLDTLNTIIVVTHDVTEGMSVADTVWLMGREGEEPGARIVETFDLAADGFAWREDLLTDPAFLQLVGMVKQCFLDSPVK